MSTLVSLKKEQTKYRKFDNFRLIFLTKLVPFLLNFDKAEKFNN